MKKQINPSTKAYLIRGAFYLLLLVAVCAIPFALAQRNTTKPSRPEPASHSYAATDQARVESPAGDQPTSTETFCSKINRDGTQYGQLHR
jgi:hypothetical protein